MSKRGNSKKDKGTIKFLKKEEILNIAQKILNDEVFLSTQLNDKPELIPVVFRPVMFGLLNNIGKRKLKHLVCIAGEKNKAIGFTDQGLPIFSTCLCLYDGDWADISHIIRGRRIRVYDDRHAG